MSKFCVLGLNGPMNNSYRRWFDSRSDARDYAASLLVGKAAGRILIVEVVEIVEVALPPVTIRPPSKDDFR